MIRLLPLRFLLGFDQFAAEAFDFTAEGSAFAAFVRGGRGE